MKGSLLLIACLLAVVLMVVEGKAVAEKKEKAVDKEHESDEDRDESEEEEVGDSSGSGSGKYVTVKFILRLRALNL